MMMQQSNSVQSMLHIGLKAKVHALVSDTSCSADHPSPYCAMSASRSAKKRSQASNLPVVYISNLAYGVTANLITAAFEDVHVNVVSVELLKKGRPSRQLASGLASVILSDSSKVARSCEVLDGQELLGRPMILRADHFASDDFGYSTKPLQTATRPPPQAVAQ